MFSCYMLLFRDRIQVDRGCSAVGRPCLCSIRHALLPLQVVACAVDIVNFPCLHIWLSVCLRPLDHCRWTQRELKVVCTLGLPRFSGFASIECSMSSAAPFEAASNLLAQVSACSCKWFC